MESETRSERTAKKGTLIVKDVMTILKENISHFGMTYRIAKYEDKASYQSHYLGMIWQYLNPAIQVGVYFLVFGMGLRASSAKAGVPYIVWMLVGIVPWFFMSSSILGTSRSIFSKIGIVSKMKFPISILPMVNIVSNFTAYLAMMAIVLISLFANHVPVTIYWWQFIYYFICMMALLFSLGILNSTISVLIRDYHVALQSLMRLLFYLSGPIIDITQGSFPPLLQKIFGLNPLAYVISGFRDTFIYNKWFFDAPVDMLYFWCFVALVLIIGSHLHMRFRSRFVDFV